MTTEIRARIGRMGADNHNYKGGWILISGKGHRLFRMPLSLAERGNHPTVDQRGTIARSHYVWDLTHPDDPVLPGEVIHHMNGQSLDDRPENLAKLANQSVHAALHAPEIAARRRRDREGRFS